MAARLPAGARRRGATVLLSSHVLGEVAQTVDEAVVINQGRLVVHASLREIVDNGSGRSVQLRSPQLSVLDTVLRGAGTLTDRHGDDGLTVMGGRQEAIGQLAFDHGIVLHEIFTGSTSVEEAFSERSPVEAVVT